MLPRYKLWKYQVDNNYGSYWFIIDRDINFEILTDLELSDVRRRY